MAEPEPKVWRWWRVVRERGPDEFLCCQDNLGRAHGEAKMNGSRVWADTGWTYPNVEAESGTLSIDWDTVVFVFPSSFREAAMTPRRVPVSE